MFKIQRMDKMFYGCFSLLRLPDISIWLIEDDNKNIENMFNDCYSLLYLPNISKVDFSYIANNCINNLNIIIN